MLEQIKTFDSNTVAFEIIDSFTETDEKLAQKLFKEKLDSGFQTVNILVKIDQYKISQTEAKAFFEDLKFDSVTVAPYMGSDSVEPFLAFEDKFTILLALTSNKGGLDFQGLKVNENKLYKEVLQKAITWKNNRNLMFVVGATKVEYFKDIREIVPNHFLLVPGVGAQGGNLQDVCKYGLTKNVGLLINSSRGIIYAGKDENFATKAKEQAFDLQQQMEVILSSL